MKMSVTARSIVVTFVVRSLILCADVELRRLRLLQDDIDDKAMRDKRNVIIAVGMTNVSTLSTYPMIFRKLWCFTFGKHSSVIVHKGKL
jgi:hypothetical protein